ncbi:MAG: alpha/beta hydrolase [Eggerthellaceae bacterium]|nr:alpha/beta hydrolase [Eggerthellaceae bacterium]
MIAFAHVDDIAMKYCRFGTGPRTLVILPGLSIKSVADGEEALAQAFSLFTDQFTVYVLDRRENLPETYGIEDMAADTAVVLESLGVAQACVFGASQGGMIAQVLAAKWPHLVSRLVLGSTTARGADSAPAVVNTWETLARQGRVAELVDATVRYLYSPATVAAFGDMIRAGMAHITPEDLRRFVILASGTPAFDARPLLPAIKAKTFVIGCFGDEVVGWQASVDLARTLGCPLYLYGPEYGHSVYDEAPDYRKRLFAFFTE